MARVPRCVAGATAVLALALFTGGLGAQAPRADSSRTSPLDTLALQRLVSDGHGDAARARVDSLLAAAPTGSARYAELLYWRASLASNIAAAQRDYQRLAVEFPLSPRSEDALMRLAQMEIARGDRETALQHLQRMVLEHPSSASRPQANYWIGRVELELGETAQGCQALRQAQAEATPSAIELRNQIDFLSQRCEAALAAAADSATADSAAARAESTAARGGGVRGRSAAAGATSGAAAPAKPAPTRATVPDAKSPKPVVSAPPAGAAPPPARAAAWTVQVAAFPAKSSADALAAKLKTQGYPVRVSGTHSPYRVRVGRYTTREAADQMAQRLKRAGMEAWIAEAEPQ